MKFISFTRGGGAYAFNTHITNIKFIVEMKLKHNTYSRNEIILLSLKILPRSRNVLTRVPNRRTQVPKRVNGQVPKRTGPETSGTQY